MIIDGIPNQKQLTINREKVYDSKDHNRKYLIIYQDNLLEAMQNLSANTFKIYLWLCFHKQYSKVAFSPEFFCKNLNMCKDTARKALKELIDKKYVLEGNNIHNFQFYEHNKLIPTTEEKNFYQQQVEQLQQMIVKLQERIHCETNK